MATSKTNSTPVNGSNAAGGTITSEAVDLSAAQGANCYIALTNGPTGPTVAAQVQIQTSGDNTNWVNHGGALTGVTTNSAVSSWSIDLPPGIKYVRFVVSGNTGQAVTARVDITPLVVT